MQCLVTGATGYLGRALTPALLAAGHSVIGQHAGASRSGGATTPDVDIELIQRDFRAGARGVIPAGTDCVFHLAGLAHQFAESDDYLRVNVTATLDLARDALDRGVRRFVFVSSVKAQLAAAGAADASGLALDRESDLESASEPVRDYASSKAAAEAGLREICSASDLELIILRPALIYSADAPGHLQLLRRWVERRLPRPPVGGGRSMIAREDLVRLLVLLTTRVYAGESPLIVTDGEVYSTRRIHRALCDARHRGPLLPSPPRAFWRLGASLHDRLRGLPAGSTWERLVGEECYRQQGLAALGFEPELTLERCLGLPS